MSADPLILDTKPVFVVLVTTRLGDGSFVERVICACETEATARRRAHKADIAHDSDGKIMLMDAIQIELPASMGAPWAGCHAWYVPGNIDAPTREDEAAQVTIDAENIAIARARKAGLDDADIAALRGRRG